MRLPWPFGRRTQPDGPSSAAPEAGGPDARPAETGSSPSAVAPTGAWAHLPPIQRTVGRAPLVAPSAPFLDDVPGHQGLPPIVTPLGHDTGPSAPPGLVVAHPHPVPALTSHAELPTRPVQRRTTAQAGATAWEPAGAPPAEPSPSGPTVEPPATPDTAPVAPEPAPVRQLRAVTPAATVTPPAQPLTRTTTLVARGPLISRSAAKDGPLAGAPWLQPSRETRPAVSMPQAAAPAAGSGQASRWAEATPSTPTSAGGARLPAMPDAPGPARRGAREAAVAPEPAPSVDAGTRRRAGLGAPIASPPVTVAQRMPIRSHRRPPALEPAAVAQRDAAAVPRAPTPMPAPERPSAPVPGSPASAPRLPVLPVARRASAEASSPASTAATAVTTGAPSAPARERASAAPGGTRPTLGLRPLRPSVAATFEPAGAPETPVPVNARWTAPESLPPVVDGPATSVRSSEPAPVQLSPLGATPSPLRAEDRAPGIATDIDGMREIVFPPRDTAFGVSPAAGPAGPGLGTAPVQREAATAVQPRSFGAPGPAAGPAGAGQTAMAGRSRPLTLARTAVTAASPAAVGAPASGAGAAPVVARIVADPASPSSSPVVQASGAGPSAGTPVGTITATPVVQRVDGAAPPAETPSTGHSDRELDDLARALFGRIRTHLRTDVIHEREAKGLTYDAF